MNRRDTSLQKRVMIVTADTLLAIDEDLVVSELASRLPDDVLQPLRARRIATELEIFVTHHVEQDHRARERHFGVVSQLRNIMTTAVRVVRALVVAAVTPVLTKSLFAVKEHEPVSRLRLLPLTAKHARDLEQRRDGRCRIVRADKLHVSEILRIVVAPDAES